MPHTIWTVTANLLMIFNSERKSTVHNGGVERDALITDRSPSLCDSIFGSHPLFISAKAPKSLRNCLLSEDRNSVRKYPQQVFIFCRFARPLTNGAPVTRCRGIHLRHCMSNIIPISTNSRNTW